MEQVRDNSAIVYSAAAIYGGAALIGLVEGVLPGGPSFSMAPSVGALVLTALILLVGRRLPRPALAALGPLGAAMIGFALATTYGQTDAAVFYMWPALWMAHFYGRAGTFFIVAWIGLVHAVAVAAMPAGGNVDRWIDVTGSVLVVAAVVRGLSARSERLVERLKAEARVDPLSGLLNRRGLHERMGVEAARARRERGSLAAVALDLDHFKDVNDRHGHEVGDRVIAWLGATMREHVRGVDIAARLGGDEFAVVMVGAGESEALALAERIRAAVGGAAGRERFGVPAGLPISLSAGVAAATAPADAERLLAAADAALYGAKRAGRDRALLRSGGDGAGRR